MNTIPTQISSRELLSALADGELSHDELSLALAACAKDGGALESWSSYHLIGSVLRTPAEYGEAAQAASPMFLDRLKSRLSQESALHVEPSPALTPLTPATKFAPSSSQIKPSRVPVQAANDSLFRWKMVAGFASLAAVSVLAWNSFLVLSTAPSTQLAQSLPAPSEQVLIASPQGTIVRDARFEELLAAHRQMGGTSALQVPSGFLRNATFEAQQNGSR